MLYLAALEEERFDELPPGYAGSFLRTYASYLDLDPERLVDEYRARFPSKRPIPARRPTRDRRVWVPPRAAILLLAGVVALLAVLVAGEVGSRKGTPDLQTPGPRPPRHLVASSSTAHVLHPRKAERQRRRIVLRASAGECWIAVRFGSEGGPLLYEHLLRRGEAVSFVRMPLWVRVGAPENLVLTVDGRRLARPAGYGPVNVVVGPGGIRTV
jgi:hypothetical protein